MTKVILYTRLDRVAQDIIQIKEEHNDLKEIDVVLPWKDIKKVRKTTTRFKDIIIRFKSYENPSDYNVIYLNRYLRSIPSDLDGHNIHLLGETIVGNITKILLDSGLIYLGDDPTNYEIDTVDQAIVSSIYLDDYSTPLEVIEQLNELSPSTIYTYNQCDARLDTNLRIQNIGDKYSILASLQDDKIHLADTNGEDFVSLRNSFTSEYIIFQVLDYNRVNIGNLINALSCYYFRNNEEVFK